MFTCTAQMHGKPIVRPCLERASKPERPHKSPRRNTTRLTPNSQRSTWRSSTRHTTWRSSRCTSRRTRRRASGAPHRAPGARPGALGRSRRARHSRGLRPRSLRATARKHPATYPPCPLSASPARGGGKGEKPRLAAHRKNDAPRRAISEQDTFQAGAWTRSTQTGPRSSSSRPAADTSPAAGYRRRQEGGRRPPIGVKAASRRLRRGRARHARPQAACAWLCAATLTPPPPAFARRHPERRSSFGIERRKGRHSRLPQEGERPWRNSP